MNRRVSKLHNVLFGRTFRVPVLLVAILLFMMLCNLIFVQNVYGYENVTIVIDAGHGGEVSPDDEANSGAVYHDLEEKNVNLVTALALYDELEQYENVTVYLTRDIDEEISIDRRAEFASEVGADLIVSVHYNASADHNLFGAEVFTSAFGDCYGVGHALGEVIMDEWAEHGSILKDVKTRIGKSGKDYYGLIRLAHEYGIPAIILEHGYLDNDKDYLRIKSEEAWKELGKADATAIAKFYGLKKDIVQENVGPTVDVSAPEEPVMPDDTEPTGVKLIVDEYNSNKGDIEFSLYAYDDESKLMYYGFKLGDVDEDTVFDELEKWEGKNGKLTGTYHIQPGYEGPITATVFNVYQLDAKSNTIGLIPNEEAPDDEADNALIEKEEAPTLAPEEQESSEEAESSKEEISVTMGYDKAKAETAARANAIDKNTESTVKNSYTGLLIAGLIAAVTLAVAIVVMISSAQRKRRRRKRKAAGEKKSYDWMDE